MWPSAPEGRWPFQVPPAGHELLSGYLCRLARMHGLSSHGFVRICGADVAFWARDVDRLQPESRLLPVCQALGESLSVLRGLSLAPWMPRLGGPGNGRGIAPWINAIGIFHRDRLLHGLAFCPACLAESPVLDRSWRLSFVTVCERHGVGLQDACPCGAAFCPHRIRGDAWRCHACGRDLRSTTVHPSRATSAQRRLTALLDSSVSADSALTTSAAYRVLVSAIGTARRRAIDDPQPDGSRHQLETARVSARDRDMVVLSRLIDDWPASFRAMADEGRLVHSDFKGIGLPPTWLRNEVDRLPRCASRRSRRSRFNGVIDLGARRYPNWRARRAALMLKAAGR